VQLLSARCSVTAPLNNRSELQLAASYKSGSPSFTVKQLFEPHNCTTQYWEYNENRINIFKYIINCDVCQAKSKNIVNSRILTRCENSVCSTALFEGRFYDLSVRHHQKTHTQQICACVKSDMFIACCSHYLQMWDPMKYSKCHYVCYFIT
jgi:hypothetical protein